MIFIVILNLPLNAQEHAVPGKLKLKLHMNSIYERSSDNTYSGSLDPGQSYIEERKDLDLGIFSVALEMIQTGRTSHQFELMPFRFRRQDVQENIIEGDLTRLESGGISTAFQSTLGYQYIYYFRSDKILRPYVGPAIQLFCDMSNYHPYFSLSYPVWELDLGLLMAATPGMEIKLGEKFSLDLNLPLGLYDFKLNSVRVDNPTLIINQRRTSRLIGDIPPGKFNLRIGLSYKI